MITQTLILDVKMELIGIVVKTKEKIDPQNRIYSAGEELIKSSKNEDVLDWYQKDILTFYYKIARRHEHRVLV